MGSSNNKITTKPPFVFASSSNPNPNPRNTTTSSDTEDNKETTTTNKNPNNSLMDSSESILPLTITGTEEDEALRRSNILSREEVLRRRSRRTKQLLRFYKDQYWALMDEVRSQYRDFYWKFGKSPFQEDDETEIFANGEANGGGGGATEENGGTNHQRGADGMVKRCGFTGCKTKAMAFTSFCHAHILSDSKQKLYKGCDYVVKSAQNGPVLCGKSILRATVPSLCTLHFQKAQTHVTRALKKAGLNVSSSNTVAPKLHLIVTESVRQINAKRREQRINAGNAVVREQRINAGNTVVSDQRVNAGNVMVKEESAG